MKNLLIILLVVILSSYVYGGNKKIIFSDTTFNGIKFSEVTFVIDKKTNDTLQIIGVLKQETTIDGIPCNGNISFTDGWQLRSFTLAEDYTFGENQFPKDTHIQYHIKIDKLEHYFAIRNSRIYTVNVCRFKTEQLINGILCEKNEDVIFKKDMSLLACILAEADTIAGNVFEKGTFIRFDEDGICCYCLYDPEIQSFKCKGDNYKAKLWTGSSGIKLYSSGKLKYFQPIENVKIQGILCKPSGARGGITLYESGKLKECTSAIDQTIDGVFCGKKYNVQLDEHGLITKAEKDKIF